MDQLPRSSEQGAGATTRMLPAHAYSFSSASPSSPSSFSLPLAMTSGSAPVALFGGSFFLFRRPAANAVDDDFVGVGVHRRPRRQVANVFDVQLAADLQRADPDVQFVRHQVERHFDLDRVDQMLDDAAVVHARGFALELDRHFDRHLVAGHHAEQIDVQHLVEERVPVHFLQQGLAGGGAFEVDDLRAVADDRFELFRGEREADRFFAVTVEHRGQLAVDDAVGSCFVCRTSCAARRLIDWPWICPDLLLARPADRDQRRRRPEKGAIQGESTIVP